MTNSSAAFDALGTGRLYRFRGEDVDAAAEYFTQLWGDAASRFRLVVENTSGSGT